MGPGKVKISVVIPTRNEASDLEASLKQYIPLKEKFGLEVVVSDGNSTDGTLEIARRYADKVVLAEPGKKQNIPIGRNAGCLAASGEFIFSTDADVVIPDPDRFFAEVFKAFEDPKVVCVAAPLKIFKDQEILADRFWHFVINNCVRFGFRFGIGRGECQIFRASIFRQIGGFDETVVPGEDGNLFYRMNKIGRIAYLRNIFIYHSPRRFRNVGYIPTMWMYFVEGLSLLILRKSHVKEYSVVR